MTVEELAEDAAPLTAIENLIDLYRDAVDRFWLVGPTSTSIDRPDVDLAPVGRRLGNSFSGRVLGFILYQFRLALAVRSVASQADAVFFHIGGTLSPLPVLVASVGGSHAVVIVTGSPPDNYRAQHTNTLRTRVVAKTLGLVEKITCTLSDDIIVLSESMREGLLPRWSSTERHVANLNYIETSGPDNPPATDTRDSDLIFVGRFTSEKGVQQLVRAVPRLVDAHPSLLVTLVGDGPLRTELEAFVDGHGVGDNVEFTGWVGRDEVNEQLCDARILVMPSYSEGLPKVLLEGMVNGTVPVATRVGGVADVIRDGENGVLLPDNDPGTLEEVLQDVLERDDLQQMNEASRKIIEEQFSFEATKNAYIDVLNDVVSEELHEYLENGDSSPFESR